MPLPAAANRRTALAMLLPILVSDQISKLWILSLPELTWRAIPVFPGFNLVKVANYGVSFGLFNQMPEVSRILFSLLAIVISLVLWRWLATVTSRVQVLAMGAVIGGALGNMIDRVRLGAVVDFLDFYLGRYHWPAFNIADSAIVCGVLVLIATEWQASRKGVNHA
jgi:signal peptidase II